MNRLEFMHNVDLQNKEFASTTATLFDQLMLLYNFTNSYDAKIVYNGNDNNQTTFIMQGNQDDVDSLCRSIALCNGSVNLYGRTFTIHANNNKTEAEVCMI